MPSGIYKRTPEMQTGKHMFGRKLPIETLQKMRKSMLGKNTYKKTEEHKKKISETKMGSKHTEETKKKISKNSSHTRYWLNKKFTKEHKKKMSESMKKNPVKYWLGKKISIEHRKKIGDSQRGEKSHFWQGGITNSPYAVDWTKTLKRSIRERDNYICQVCGELQKDEIFSVHHIDYNKLNCNPENLITLCRKCHTRTNFKRTYWLNYFLCK